MAIVRDIKLLTDPAAVTIIHHSPNGGKRAITEAARFQRMGTLAGFHDLLCLWLPVGRSLPRIGFLEVKAAKGALSDTQKDFGLILGRCNIPYAVVRSSEEALAALKSWGYPLRPFRMLGGAFQRL